MKSNKIRKGQVDFIEEQNTACRISERKPERKSRLEDLGVDGCY
jgi:hypothetical protein